MTERDMYYNSYGYGGFTPNNIMPNNFPQMINTPFPNQMSGQSTYTNSQFNDINERVSRLERQVKRLDQRLTRLETPYANNLNTEPDNNMYMM